MNRFVILLLGLLAFCSAFLPCLADAPKNPEATMHVAAIGALQKPGALQLPASGTILQALEKAGGLLHAPENSALTFHRMTPQGKHLSWQIDLTRLLAFDPAQNVMLQNGDVIVVSEVVKPSTISVVVGGEVERPNLYELQPGEELTEVLKRAGLKMNSAALKNVRVTNTKKEDKFYDLTPLREGKKVSVPLQNGDLIEVPANKLGVFVLGEVVKPGRVIIPENGSLTVGQAIAASGSLKATARQILLLKSNDLKSSNDLKGAQTIELDDTYDGVKGRDIVVKNDQIIYVSERLTKRPLTPPLRNFRLWLLD